jgi:hypothetical protein
MDPGRMTGLMWATITLKGSTEEVFKRDPPEFDQVNCQDFTADREFIERAGAREIASRYQTLVNYWSSKGIPPEDRFFIYESFDLFKVGSFERHGLSPVRVTSLIQGMLDKDEVNWAAYSSGLGSQINNQRLRNFGLWSVGQQHARSAARIGAVWVRQNL